MNILMLFFASLICVFKQIDTLKVLLKEIACFPYTQNVPNST